MLLLEAALRLASPAVMAAASCARAGRAIAPLVGITATSTEGLTERERGRRSMHGEFAGMGQGGGKPDF